MWRLLLIRPVQNTGKVKQAMSWGFCCIKSILCSLKSLLWGFNHKQNASIWKATMNISDQFYQRGLTIINFLRFFVTRTIKTWKNWPSFSTFNQFPSMPSVATGDRKQFQYLQIVFNNKTRSFISFRIQLMRRHLLAFYKVAK